MDAEQVVEKILADAKAEADEITKQAEQSQAAEQAQLNKQLDEYKKQTEVLAQNSAEDEKSHLLAAARMDIAKQFLAEKTKILDEVFAQARQNLQNLPDDQYRELMAKLMSEAVETGEEEVIVDNNETRIDRELIDRVNQKLSQSGKGSLKLSDEKQKLGAGFILRQGRIKNNVSVDILLTQARKELGIELAKQLFGN